MSVKLLNLSELLAPPLPAMFIMHGLLQRAVVTFRWRANHRQPSVRTQKTLQAPLQALVLNTLLDSIITL